MERPYQLTPLFLTSFSQRFQFCHYFFSTISLFIDLFFWTVCVVEMSTLPDPTRDMPKLISCRLKAVVSFRRVEIYEDHLAQIYLMSLR